MTQQHKTQTLSAGISKAIGGFDALPAVENELQAIQNTTQAEVLL
ncbi:hypothetical protein [[Leptolyngbya] sp. PCC 7376]|nr:hypothetical protein [[Leptolyngbya] sp. PCC 7376]